MIPAVTSVQLPPLGAYLEYITRHRLPPPIAIELGEPWLKFASYLGRKRAHDCKQRGWVERHAPDTISLEDRQYLGAAAELAVAKWVGVWFEPHTAQSSALPDVPPDWQVRYRPYPHYELFIQPHEAPRAFRHVLVLGAPPVFLLAGWIWAKDGARDEWRQTHGGRHPEAFFVPRAMLRPMQES